MLSNKQTKLNLAVLLIILALFCVSAQAQTELVKLLKDINPITESADIREIVEIDGTAFFRADDGAHGLELCKSDGTETGTVIVKDINPGGDGSNVVHLTNVDGTLFFLADDGTYSFALWKSDGTEAGTVMVKDINPSDSTSGAFYRGPLEMTNMNGTLFFVADDGTNGEELWVSDGTEAGTFMVRDINPDSGDSSPSDLVNVNGTLFFAAEDETHGRELWKSDGTEAGTVMVKDINPGSINSYPSDLININGTLFFGTHAGLWKSDGTEAGTVMIKDFSIGGGIAGPSELINVNGTLFFSADDGANGRELWKSDGTEPNTVMVKDINPNSNSSYPQNMIEMNGMLYFQAGNEPNGRELWKSDGTEAGTVMVKDIWPGIGSPWPENLTNVNGTLFFRINNETYGSELWKSDGTEAGTAIVKDIIPGGVSSYPMCLTDVDGTLFFIADDGTHGFELWKSYGTEESTRMVKDLNTNTLASIPVRTRARGFCGVEEKTFFVADNETNGSELWVSDGTSAGTVMVRDINPGSADSCISGPWGPQVALTDVNGTLFFMANDGMSFGLWKSDGTDANTVMVKGISGHSIDSLTNVNGTLFFLVGDETHGREPWVSDGTEAGTVMVRDIYPGSESSVPRYFTNVDEMLFFSADDGTNGRELWVSDGTEAGTVMVRDINPDSNSSGAGGLTNVNGTLFFAADDGTNGYELWKSDGTEAGTVMVRDINPNSNNSSPGNLFDVNGTLFFWADDGTNGRELWRSDGTEPNTVMVKDINPSVNYYPSMLTNVNGMLFFTADDGTHGEELWVSDGTEAGTFIIRDICPGSDGSSLSYLTEMNGMLFFAANDGTNGEELWVSDGTEAGTVMVKDIRSGGDIYTNSSGPRQLTNVNGTLLFWADDDVNGVELWKSDGTEAGTVIVKDIYPGSGDSFPYSSRSWELINVNGTLFFVAEDGSHGEEPWIWKLIFPTETPAGVGVVVEPEDTATGEIPVTLTFDNVTDAGETTMTSTTLADGQEPPAGLMLGEPPVVFDISTTAGFTGQVEVCMDYSGFSFNDEEDLQLLHSEDGINWTDVTSYLDTDSNVICGTVDGFSLVGIFEGEPNIDISSSSYYFGHVELGTSRMGVVTISNAGDGNLTIDNILIQAVSSDFSITSALTLPVVVEPGEAVDVEVTFTPSAEEYSWVVMEIGSNDPDESYIEVELDATGILPLSEQIADIRTFFDESVEQGTLAGCGRLPRLAKLRLEIMRIMLELADKIIDRGFDRIACLQLRCIYKYCDGQSRPSDLVEGEAVAELASMVQDLATNLECE